MPKASHPTMEDDYELQPTSSEPLLPRYEAHKPSPSSPTPSPYQQHELRKRHSRFRKTISCLCLTLLVLIPSIALAACYFGQLGDRLRWESLPEDVKDWLEKVVSVKPAPDPGAFPTDIGYAGPTPTGYEAALLATAPAPPIHTGVSPLLPPPSTSQKGFNIIQHWGNLSPYYSVQSHGLPETSSLLPESCQLDELHWLQRHGARYPTITTYGPAAFASRLKAAKGWKANGDLAFLNSWEYQLGAEVLTPFGRSQLFNLGVAARIKYGFLLDKMKGRLPVFRTESQDRMLRSAQNFATGFFGYPAEDQYNLEVTIESPGFNNTLAPYMTCLNDNTKIYAETAKKLATWDAVFLRDAQKRLQGMIKDYDFTTRDAKELMDMCAYETVALGYSAFCGLFTEKEWKGYEYRNDIEWWYTASFGSPVARASGIGYVQELVSRLSHTRLTEFNSTTNSSFHDDVHFPLNDPLYVDFTHDTVFALLLPSLNLTSFAESGPPPLDHIPKHRSFIASKFCPFATNLQFQVLTCGSESNNGSGIRGDSTASKNIRLILNDAAVPLTGIRGCPEDDDGLCPLETFLDGVRELIRETHWERDCMGDYEYDIDQVTDGRPPR